MFDPRAMSPGPTAVAPAPADAMADATAHAHGPGSAQALSAPNRQLLHDKAAHTAVLDVRRHPSSPAAEA